MLLYVLSLPISVWFVSFVTHFVIIIILTIINNDFVIFILQKKSIVTPVYGSIFTMILEKLNLIRSFQMLL